MKGYSKCCQAELIIEEGVEYFHGCDDDYELKIPFVLCSKCRTVQLLPAKAVNDEEVEKRLLKVANL